MYYCFLLEDIIDNNNPLYIQAEYAKKSKCYCIASLKQQTVLDSMHRPVDLSGQTVFLRTTCENAASGLKLLERLGAIPIETEHDIVKIEEWYTLNLTCRKVQEINVTDILRIDPTSKFYQFIVERDFVFLKSKKKGFSGVIRSSKILNSDFDLRQYLLDECKNHGAQLLLSEYQQIKVDSMGERESRHFVFNNKVTNSSRTVHSIRHTVPRSHRDKAKEVVERLRDVPGFPCNYVLDIGDFILEDDEVTTDIIELNPITSSMCYVNNSVFSTVLPEIERIRAKYMFGPEYCLDSLMRPQDYHYDRAANKIYAFSSESKRDFL